MTHIFVDESGDIGLSENSRRFFIYGFIYCVSPSVFRCKLIEQLRILHKYDLYPRKLHELKFRLPRNKLLSIGYTQQDLQRYKNSMGDIRAQICDLIGRYSDGIFAAIIDKHSIDARSWTPVRLGNYVFANTLHFDILNQLSLPDGITLVYDDGRLDRNNSDEFHVYLNDKDSYFRNMGLRTSESFLGETKNVLSNTEPCIWAADILAGTFYYHHTFNCDKYRKTLISNCKLIQNGFRIYWK